MAEFRREPLVKITGDYTVAEGWASIGEQIRKECQKIPAEVKIIAVEYYPGVLDEEVTIALQEIIQPDHFIHTSSLFKPEEMIREMVYPDVTDDRVFGYLSRFTINDYFDTEKITFAREEVAGFKTGVILVVGPGAAYAIDNFNFLVYADMARWEIQLRMRQHLIDNLGVHNRQTPDWNLLYKQGFFVDWRVCDRWKKKLMDRWDYFLDTNNRNLPKLVCAEAIREGFRICLQRPFSLVPFFDPGPWGGQWMKKVCGLDPEVPNYAWCFNCVPEENSLLLGIGSSVIELPSIDLLFHDPLKLLGAAVYGRFGAEFPIRFDYLDTIGGGNLSLQVHPLTGYIQEKFGMHYTQDESYYIMDCTEDSVVYLGLKEGINPADMMDDLEYAQEGEKPFESERHVQEWPVHKHDHFLIPAGTVHCSGKNSMVLEISATPYIFTFKLWDWGRLGMDGRPRPINIERGKDNIQWDRTTNWTKENLVNRVVTVAEGDGWKEEKTGLHESEFIETRRHWFTGKVEHCTADGVNVICLVEGEEVLVESPSHTFEPFPVHYAETFIVPASVGNYTIRPFGKSEGKTCATLKAFVRSNP